MQYHLNQMRLLENLIDFVKENPKKIFLTSLALFLIFFISSLIFMFLVSNNTSENPYEENINFYNLTYFSLENRIHRDINLISWIDDNSLDCNNINELITVQNKSLDEIFTLNTSYINYLAKSLIALEFIMLFFILVSFCAYRKNFGFDSISTSSSSSSDDSFVSIIGIIALVCFCGCCIILMVFIVIIIFFILLIVDIIIFSIMCAQFNKDETNKFLDFLQCDGIDKDIISQFSRLSNLSINFNAMKVLHSIFIPIYAILITEITILIKG